MEILKYFFIFGCFAAIFADKPLRICPYVLCRLPMCEKTIQPPGQCCPRCAGTILPLQFYFCMNKFHSPIRYPCLLRLNIL